MYVSSHYYLYIHALLTIFYVCSYDYLCIYALLTRYICVMVRLSTTLQDNPTDEEDAMHVSSHYDLYVYARLGIYV
jgi:hypothetical protein